MEKSILVVDDEATVTLSLEEFFKSKGYEVNRAFYGDQALKCIEQKPPDLLILDLQMPGVDGIEVFREIREKHPEIKVLVVTGHSERYQQELNHFKPEAVMVKPVTLEVLTQTVSTLLEGTQPASSSKKSAAASGKVRLLFVEGSQKMYENFLKPFFESAQRQEQYELALACTPEGAFELLNTFKPHLVVLDSTRLPLGVAAGKLAADLGVAPGEPKEVILHAIPSLGPGRWNVSEQQMQKLEAAIQRAAEGRGLKIISEGA